MTTNILLTHIHQKIPLTEADNSLILPYFTPKLLRRRQYLLQEGAICTHLSFVAKGLVKAFNIDEKGVEHISLFGSEGWWISDFGSFVNAVPGMLNIDAIEDTELLMISRENYEELLQKIPKMERYFRILYQNSLVTKDKRLISSITDSAEEKYLGFANNFPQIVQRLPQNLIASYLGLAPETISRIRKRQAK